MRAALVGGHVERVLHLAQLAVAADERRLEAGRAARTVCACDDADGAPELRLAGLALELERAGFLVDDGRLGDRARQLADQHGARLGRGLDARGGVDEVAGHHSLADGADRHRRLTGEDADSRAQLLRAELLAQRGDGRGEVERRHERRARRPPRGDRRAPDGHHRVADELLDGPAVRLDQASAGVEVAREELAYRLGVARLRQRGEADEVGEEHRDEPAFGDRDRHGGRCGGA